MRFPVALLFVLVLSGCASVFPPSPESVAKDACGEHNVRTINTNDSFTWKFLGFSNSRATSLECGSK